MTMICSICGKPASESDIKIFPGAGLPPFDVHQECLDAYLKSSGGYLRISDLEDK